MLSAFVVSMWRVEAQILRIPDHIPLPSQRGEGKSLSQQPRIAEIRSAVRISLPTVNQRQKPLASAIGNLQKQRPISLAHRPQQKQIGSEYDLTRAVNTALFGLV